MRLLETHVGLLKSFACRGEVEYERVEKRVDKKYHHENVTFLVDENVTVCVTMCNINVDVHIIALDEPRGTY